MKSLKKLFGIFDEKTESMKETVNVSDVSNESSKAESREVNDEPVEKAKGTSSSQKGEDQAPENVNDENQSNSVKSKIYNMLIVDESGSMSGLTQVTLSGVNEIISTIREAQNKHADVQQHYITLVTFDERNDNKVLPIRFLCDCVAFFCKLRVRFGTLFQSLRSAISRTIVPKGAHRFMMLWETHSEIFTKRSNTTRMLQA